MYEVELVNYLKDYYCFKGYRVFREVACFNRSVDLVAVNDGSMVAVEAKLHNWKRAIEQAWHHPMGFDFTYIYLLDRPRKGYRGIIWHLRDTVIGLLIFERRTKQIIEIHPARQSELMWKPKKEELGKRLREGKHQPVVLSTTGRRRR